MKQRKSDISTWSREWAMGIVDFARGDDETRPALKSFLLEQNRIVACDGHRLAWQTFQYGEGSTDGQLVNEHFNPVDGQYFDYKAVLPSASRIVFMLAPDGDWLPALKRIARMVARPFGWLEYDNDGYLSVHLEHSHPALSIRLVIPVAAGDPKPFKIGFNLRYLYEAINAAVESQKGPRSHSNRTFVTFEIFDHTTAVVIRSSKDEGFYSITMPASTIDAHCWKPEETAEVAA